MYVIDNALPSIFKPLAIFFAVCGLIGTTAIFTANQTTAFIHGVWAKPIATDHTWLGMSLDKLLIGIVLAVLITYVLLGGLKRLASWTSAMVPVMCLFYIVGALTALSMKVDAIPAAFISIFTHAFSIEAGVGGVEGGIVAVLIIGVKRAAFSNEAGIGTAPMAHSNAKTTEPISEGLVAMLGPMIDTLIVCTMTALVILVFVPPAEFSQYNKVLLTNHAFSNAFGQWGTHTLGIAVALFGFSTMVGMANYNTKCWNYLVRDRLGSVGPKIFLVWFALTLILGSALPSGDMINLVDTAYALMAIPTMTSTLILAPHVTRALKEYKRKYIGNDSTTSSI